MKTNKHKHEKHLNNNSNNSPKHKHNKHAKQQEQQKFEPQIQSNVDDENSKNSTLNNGAVQTGSPKGGEEASSKPFKGSREDLAESHESEYHEIEAAQPPANHPR